MTKLTDPEIRWMIRRKEEGRMTNQKIARVYNITTKRLQQVWAYYRSTGQIPTLQKLGRPKQPPNPEEEELVLKVGEKHHPVILEDLIQKEHGMSIPHDQNHTLLRIPYARHFCAMSRELA